MKPIKRNYSFRVGIALFATVVLLLSLTYPAFAQNAVVPDKEVVESVLNEETSSGGLEVVPNEVPETTPDMMPKEVLTPATQIVPHDTVKPTPNAIPEEATSTKPESVHTEEANPASETVPDKAPELPAELVPVPRRTLSINTNLDTVIKEGEIVTMSVTLEGFDDVSFALQWQRKGDGEWEDIPGANDIKYQYPANETTLRYEWRVKLTILSASDSR